MQIEVYDWVAGEPRPGTHSKAKNTCIDVVDWPDHGPFPVVGDAMSISEDAHGPKHYVVVGREHQSGVKPGKQKWSKMWICVRALSESEYEQELA